MKYCTTCSSEYADKFRFCRVDGTVLLTRSASVSLEADSRTGQVALGPEKVPTEYPSVSKDVSTPLENSSLPHTKYCPACDSEYTDRYRFCRLDGTPLVEKQIGELAQAVANKEESQERKPEYLPKSSVRTESVSELSLPSINESTLPAFKQDPPVGEKILFRRPTSTADIPGAEFRRRLHMMPEDLKEAYYSDKITDLIYAIGANHQLVVEQIGELGDAIGLVMLGFTHVADFADNLEWRLRVSSVIASAIAADIDSCVFSKVRRSLQYIEQAIGTENISEPMAESPPPLTLDSSATATIPVNMGRPQESARDLPNDVEPRETELRPPSKPVAGKGFELLAQEEIKRAFPESFVREGVQIRSFRRTAEVDLFVLMPKGLFLIECKNYSGKIRGSFNYDQKQGEFWTCQNATGEIVQITSSGKNPADQALTRFHALHDMAKDAWGEANRPYIYPILLFPDGADLSGITQMTVYPERPSTADRVVATTLSKLLNYLANSESSVERTGALKLIEFLGIPKASLSGTWLDKPIETEQRPRPNEGTNKPGGTDQGGVVTPIDERPDIEFDEKKKDEFGTNISSEQGRHTSKSPWKIVAGAGVFVILLLFFGWRFYWDNDVAKQQKLASRQLPPSPKSAQTPIPPPTMPEIPAISTDPQAPPPIVPPETKKPREPLPRFPTEPPVVKSTERPIPRRSAEPGTYETVRTTTARREPNDVSEVIDDLKPRTRLNVTGSLGDWLVVKSRTRQMTVYVKRDDAMFVSVRSPSGDSYQVAEAQWKKVEADIVENLAKWVPAGGVTASFREGTAYLEGQVKTDYERFRAEMAAKSIPEVQQIINRIKLNP